MATSSYDVVVVGGGPGGYVAAIRAAQLGLRAAVVEREHLGGICLNWGCIPTKALLRSAEIFHLARHAKSFGISAGEIGFDLDAIVKRSRAVSAQLQSGVRHLLKKNEVAVVTGHGRLAGKGRVAVTDKDGKSVELQASHIILATGARPRVLPGLQPDGRQVWTYKEAMTPPVMPQSLLVVGSGAIGIEFASFYRTLGAEVTVVEALEQILPMEDHEIAAMARKLFEQQGMRVMTSAKVKSLQKDTDAVTATIETATATSQVRAQYVLLATGITANTEDLGLAGTGVVVERGHVVVNQWLQTGEPGVYAIGDLTAPPWLAHKASHEAIICVEKIAGLAGVRPLDAQRVPSCTYCRPQIASIGLTEKKAVASGFQVKVGRFPLAANGKAIAMGETEGLVKTVFDAATGELLGAHMIGAEVTEMIQGYAIANTLEATEAELMHTVFPHPTISETMHEAALGAFGHAIHI